MDQDDPIDWSIDRVIQEVCYNKSPIWAVGVTLKPIIDRDTLASALKDNDINGDNLLALEDQDIKSDLGITSFGRRRPVNAIIAHLRTLSPKYQAQLANRALLAQLSKVDDDTTPPRKVDNSLQQKFVANPLKRQWQIDDDVIPTASSNGVVPVASPNPKVFEANKDTNILNATPVATSVPPIPQSRGLQKKAPKRAILIPVTGNVPQDSRFISSTAQNGNLNTVSANSNNLDQAYLPEPDAAGPSEPPSKRLKVTDAPKAASANTPRGRYRRADAIVATGLDKVTDNLLVTDDTSFHLTGTYPATGLVKHALKLVKLPVSDQDQLVSQSEPAPLNVSKSGKDDKVEAEWTIGDPGFELSPELQAMLLKYPTLNDEPDYPYYGESDDDDRYTSTSQSPAPADSGMQKALRSEMVDQAIDENFEKIRADWRVRQLPRCQMKAYKKWKIAANNRFLHPNMLQDCKQWRNKASDRVQKLRDGVHLSEWRNLEDIKQQCLAIEVSIHQFEEYDLYVKVLECQQEPFKPSQSALAKARKSRPRTPIPEGEEYLESDSDNSFIIDEYAPTIEDDSRWVPEFTLQPHTATKDQKHVEHNHHDGGEIVLDSIEDGPSSVTLSNLASETPALPQSAYEIIDLDSESTPAFLPPKRGPSKLFTKQDAAESAKRNPMAIPEFTSSEEETSDFERRPSLPSTKFAKQGKSVQKAIDLTSTSSPSPSERYYSLEIRTPKLNSVDPSTLPEIPKQSQQLSDLVSEHTHVHQDGQNQSQIMDVENVLDMYWDDIEPGDETQVKDSRLALAKIVYETNMSNTHRLLDYLKSLEYHDLAEVLQNGLIAEKDYEDEIENVEQKNQANANLLTKYFLTYTTGCNVMDSEFDIAEEDVNDAHALLQEGVQDFFKLLKSLLQNHIKHAASRSTSRDIHVHDLSQDTDMESEVPIKTKKGRGKRKVRNIIREKEISRQQLYDQKLAASQEKKRAIILQQQSLLGVEEQKLSIAINTDEPLVYLHPKLAASVKPHQVEGIQFMWREIIDNERQQGCLLAHTMGLGKTMQVISLLTCIAQCNKSNDTALQNHIPEHLRKLRVLILCPYALVENWHEEFFMWLPDPMLLGVITKLDQFIRQPETTIAGWAKKGGVLIMSYDRFRGYIFPNKKTSLEDQHQDMMTSRRDHLLNTPDIVIADEAHRLKNAKSMLSQAATMFRTKSRIALTGSPLNNALEEYHTMIDWLSPGYLGTMREFRARFSEPIERGLYNESTQFERRAALKKLHVLKRNIAPKVHRADIKVLGKDMLPKVEFVINLSLTDEQKSSYGLFVKTLRDNALQKEGKKVKINNGTLWGWLGVLVLLLNHPSTFVRKLQENGKHAQSLPTIMQPLRVQNDDEASDVDPLGEDVDLAEQPILSDAMQKVVDVFQEARVLVSMEDSSLSHKSLVATMIIEEAVREGEKTLLFTQSIKTLNYYEQLVKEMGWEYKRIDGSPKTPGFRQRAVADFNAGDNFKVFLISTKAGGLGLNIQSASRVIINDFGYNPAQEEQAIGRAYRLGQTKPVYVYRLMCAGTYEELVNNRAVYKQQLFTHVVDQRNVLSRAVKDAGTYLRDPQDCPQQDLQKYIGKDPKVLDHILNKVTCVRSITSTETYFMDDDEDLNEQELKEANEEFELDRLQRENPEEYTRRINHQEALEAQRRKQAYDAALQRNAQRHIAPAHERANTVGNQPARSHFMDWSQFVNVGSGSRPDAHQLPAVGDVTRTRNDGFAATQPGMRSISGYVRASQDDSAGRSTTFPPPRMSKAHTSMHNDYLGISNRRVSSGQPSYEPRNGPTLGFFERPRSSNNNDPGKPSRSLSESVNETTEQSAAKHPVMTQQTDQDEVANSGREDHNTEGANDVAESDSLDDASGCKTQ